MTLLDSTRHSADVDPLVHTAAAGGAQRLGAIAIDVGMPIVLGAAGVAFAAASPGVGWILVVAAAASVIATVVALARTGRSLGNLVLGLRTVARATGAPAGTRLLTSARGTYDLRRGRDPVSPALAPFEFPAERTVAMPTTRAVPARAALVELDSGQRLALTSALILGRTPVAEPDAPASVYQWSDLSRTLSKSHARLEWDGQLVWITDLGSTNGTFLRAGRTPQQLLPFQRTPLPAAATLELGDRIVNVRVPS